MNTKNETSEVFFPTDYDDYYYRYEIFNLKRVKSFYNSINEPLLFSYKSAESPWDNYISKDFSLSKEDVYIEYKKLYDGFNYYIDKLINKSDINSDMDFKKVIETLVINVTHLNELLQTYLLHYDNKKFCNTEIIYNGKTIRVSSLLLLNNEVICKINSDNIMHLVTKFYSNSIYLGILIGLFIFAITYINNYIGVVFGILFIIFAVIYLRCHRQMEFYEKLEPLYNTKYSYVAHPLTKKINFKDIITVLSIIKDIKK